MPSVFRICTNIYFKYMNIIQKSWMHKMNLATWHHTHAHTHTHSYRCLAFSCDAITYSQIQSIQLQNEHFKSANAYTRSEMYICLTLLRFLLGRTHGIAALCSGWWCVCDDTWHLFNFNVRQTLRVFNFKASLDICVLLTHTQEARETERGKRIWRELPSSQFIS